MSRDATAPVKGGRLSRLVQSILTRLILLGVLLVVLAAVLRYVFLSDSLRDSLRSLAVEQQLVLANHVARDVDHKIGERRLLLQRLALNLPRPLLERPAALRAWLQARHEFAPGFGEGLLVLDRQGRLLGEYPPRDRHGEDFAGLAALPLLPGGTSEIGRPFRPKLGGDAMLPMVAAVENVRGEVVALLVGLTGLAAPGFLDALRQDPAGGKVSFQLISPRDRLFVAASQASLMLQPLPQAGLNPLYDAALAGQWGSGTTRSLLGEAVLSVIVPVPGADWFVVASMPTGEAFRTLGEVQRFIIRNALLAIIIFTAVFSAFLYGLLRPLLRAARQADRMTQGRIPLEPLAIVRNDEVGHLIGAFNRLLEKLREQQANLARLAHHDALTGLPNRLLLSDRLQQALARAGRRQSRLALFFFDLDGFKPINDTLGHGGGDEALRQVAERFSAIVRQGDTLARVGGDEFVLLIGDLEDSAMTAVATLQAPLSIGGAPCRLGVSIGIALGDGRSKAHEFLLAADRAMYQAKAAGRGRYVIDDGLLR